MKTSYNGARSLPPPKKSKYNNNDKSNLIMYDEKLDGVAYRRADLEPIDESTDNITFQWLDITLADNPSEQKYRFLPLINMFGVNDKGNSIMVTLYGFMPYFYVDCPPNWDPQRHPQLLKDFVNVTLSRSSKEATEFVVKVGIAQRQSVFGYHFGQKSNFLEITCHAPNFVPRIRQVFQDGIRIGDDIHRFQCYEANIPFILRFMIDKEVQGSNWVEFPAGKYKVNTGSKLSTCQLEIKAYFNDIVSHESHGRFVTIAPFRILSFDIECLSLSSGFCDAKNDPIIQIANVVCIQGQSDPYIKNVFVLQSCKPIVGAQVYSYGSEADLLLGWSKFVIDCDPDIITGYNINNFDFPYIINRIKKLQVKNADILGRIYNKPTKMKDTTFQSSAYGKSENIEVTIEGRVIFDLLPYMRRNHKLSSYSLNNVSNEFLGQQKEDVKYTEISSLQNGDDETRRRLAVYCLKDAYLPQLLMSKLLVLINYIEMARVSGVPISMILTRGQQIKVVSMIYRRAREEGFLIPTIIKDEVDIGDTYEGATVIEPKKGFYDKPIVTLDFASLYPSIMRAHNLCYSTLVAKEDVSKLDPSQYTITPSGDCFVRADVQVGLLPRILERLLEQRKKAKKDMAEATDPFIKSVQNGRQLALKISANSVYGFTGATVGQLPCLAISQSTTSFGRDMITKTAEYVTELYPDAQVIYGDTDSVMVKFAGVDTVAEAMKLGKEAAEKVTQIFPRPVQLEFEKVYYPYLLMNKKRYAGLFWTNPNKYDKLDAKGIETVRRDNCLLVRNLVNKSLEKILIDRDIPGAISFVKQTISDLLQNKMDISLLVITKALGKSAHSEGYSARQAHVELAERMRQRDPGSAPQVGDRVAYVIIEGNQGDPAYMKSEDPIYALENNLPIDVQYYVENQLTKPILRIFEGVIPNPESLLKGDHTRTISKPRPASNKGIMAFAKKQESCLCCRVPINNKNAVCQNCLDRAPELYAHLMSEIRNSERIFGSLWSTCQKCQSSVTQEILCSSRDCPLFYQRTKVQKDLEDFYLKIKRFDDLV